MSDPLKKDFFKGTYQNVPDWVSSSNATENVVRDKSGNIVSSKAHAEVKGKKFTGSNTQGSECLAYALKGIKIRKEACSNSLVLMPLRSYARHP